MGARQMGDTQMSDQPRFAKLLVLDLDETLIHALARGEAALPWPPQRQVAHYRVYLRPGVREFMVAVVERFAAVGVWTSATSDYAVAMLDRIVERDKLRFIFARDRCTPRRDLELDETYWLKDIRKLDGFGFDEAQILIVDDKPRGLERSYGNLVGIRPFMGDPDDRELGKLLRYLDEIGPCENVRGVEKRGWWLRYEDEFDVHFGE
jgi:TFIIF-interacting CTD phosphatase-like protein